MKVLDDLLTQLKEKIEKHKNLEWIPVIKIESGLNYVPLNENIIDIDVVNIFDIKFTRMYIAQFEDFSWGEILYKDRNIEEKLLNPGVLFGPMDDSVASYHRDAHIEIPYISNVLCILEYTRGKWDYIREIAKDVYDIRDAIWDNITR